VSIGAVTGLAGVEFTVTFDPNVLTVQSVTAGSFGSSFSISNNTKIPGQIAIAMATGSPQTGSGQLVIIDFLATGAVGSSTALTFSKILLNDGAIATTAVNGFCTIVSTYQVSGNCSYYSSNTKPVPGVQLIFDGNQTLAQTSDGSGNYAFPSVSGGDHKLTPAKSDQFDNGITAMDASYVLQHLVGLITLNSYQLTAADVNGNGFVSAMDASYILQKLVGLIDLPFPGAKKIWTFEPVERELRAPQ
jgi:hypothetical protein